MKLFSLSPQQPVIVTTFFLSLLTAFGQDAPVPPAKAIQDNSFFVEEAYNQEPGVVQHILTVAWSTDRQSGPDDREWTLAFTQEWPFLSQDHQLSYTVPYSFLESRGAHEHGIGDIFLNYRYQALYETDRRPAFAPRASLIVPTGDDDKGLGNDAVGLQFNLPVSKIVSDRWTLHANAGLTYYPDLQERSPVSFHLGGSAIYALTPRFNLMLELIGEWNEEVEAGNIKRNFAGILSPGARYAFNLTDAQLVLGAAVPVGLNRDAPDYGVFFYLSFEHKFLQ